MLLKISISLFLIQLIFAGNPEDWPEICPDLVSRERWKARPAYAVDYALIPLKNVVVHHTATGGCEGEKECAQLVRSIQNFHLDTMEFHDIGYNFLISGDGQIFEGAGWHKVGAHTRGYNSRSIGVAFIGNFNEVLPSRKALNAFRDFLACAVELGELNSQYRLFGVRQVSATLSPGTRLYRELMKWPHFTSDP